MKLKNILLIALSISSYSALASSVRDSIGIENLSGKKIILHKVEPKETYYSLSRRYNVPPKSIMDFNSNVPLSIGSVVKVPTSIDFKERKPIVFNDNPPSSSSTANTGSKTGDKRESTHVVQAKETLYGIASKYNMRVDDLKLLNNLTGNNLSVGQTLKVLINDTVSSKPEVITNNEGKPEVVKPKPVPPPVTTPPASSTNNPSKIRYVDSTDSGENLQIPKNRYGITEKNERGVAVWINDENLDNTKSYALHSIAPIGTIIKISNPMTNRSVFAKVVGKYTENETTKDVIIVINKAVADALGALDKRFLVNITYGLPNDR
ncbi:LysM peptidoglycan-binding domain-containing protein [Pseudopedobacter beijingensis]|uniref:LysM peptidoglycan-binding domain-containing protein n=1 Tax=Pseudopedobacter beijingensis TaxID=1207056 RepID=A0ABW4IG68_9SPHI